MIKLTTFQRYDGHLQAFQFRVVYHRIRTQGTSEFTIQVIFRNLIILHTALLEQCQCAVAEYPHADVCEIIVCLQEFIQLLHTWFLKHLLQQLRLLSATHKHTMVLGDVRIEPQSVAHHIGIGYRLQGLCGTYQHITAHNHGIQSVRGDAHHLLIERQLQGEQVLTEPLSPLPSEYGNRRQNLARRSIGRQSPALSAGMQDNTFLVWHLYLRMLRKVIVSLLKQPGGTTTAAELMSDRVVGTEIFIVAASGNIMEAAYEIGG